MKKLTRREILGLTLASPLVALMPKLGLAQRRNAKAFGRQSLIYAPKPRGASRWCLGGTGEIGETVERTDLSVSISEYGKR